MIFNNMKKTFLLVILFFSVISIFCVTPVLGQQGYLEDLNNQLTAAAGPDGATFQAPTHPQFIVAKIIYIASGFFGIVFTLVTFFAGFLWLTSGGNEEKVGKAKKIILYSSIGVLLCLSAYGIALLVSKSLTIATTTIPIDGQTIDFNPATIGSEFYTEPIIQTITD